MKRLLPILLLSLFLSVCPQASAQDSGYAEQYLRFVPAAADLALGLVGVPSDYDFLDRGIAFTIGGAAMLATGYSIKALVNSPRPDGTGMNSFPSGHTIFSFLGAELVRKEYGWGWGAAAYSVATGVACLRVCHNRHTPTDVLAGAGIGILCADLGYALTPSVRNALDKVFGQKSEMSLYPSYDYMTGSVAAGLALRF